jgi:hypothetical protein
LHFLLQNLHIVVGTHTLIAFTIIIIHYLNQHCIV